MQSFVYEKDQNKITTHQKPLLKTPPSTMNPFYEFITNMKPANLTLPSQNPHNQRPSSVSIPTQLSPSSQRKKSTELSDPRKIYAPNKVNQTHQMPEVQNASLLQTLRNHELREKRSRSRDNKRSRNRQDSEDPFKKQISDQHFRKTKLCPLYQKGQCKKDSSCGYAHGFKQLRCLPNFYKTKICLAFERGECKKSIEQCKYAHGERQLRSLRHDAGYSKTINGHGERHEKSQDRHKRHNRERYSESAHRNDRNHKHNYNREDQRSRDHRKQKSQQVQDPLSYKKNLPVNKQYEKFLYGDSKLKDPAVQNSMYMIPNAPLIAPKVPHSMDAYSINLGKPMDSFPRPSVPFGYSQFQRPYQNILMQNDTYQEHPSVPFYEQNPVSVNKQSYPYLNSKEPFPQKKYYPENSYPPTNNHGYGKTGYVNSYQNPSDFGQDLSKYPYKNTNEGGLNEQPYKNTVGKGENFSDSLYQKNASGYAQVSKQVGKQQLFYRNYSFYSGSYKKTEFESLNGLPSQNVSSYRNEVQNYRSEAPSNGIYDLYPALDKNINQVGKNLPQSYPVRYSEQKSRYSGFSKALPK